MVKTLTLELNANSHGYCSADIYGDCPKESCLANINIETGLKVDCTNESELCTSVDAGR